jgi:hypothetical protein
LSLDILDGDEAGAAVWDVWDETGDTRRAVSTSSASPLNRSMESSFPGKRDRDEYRSVKPRAAGKVGVP